MTSNFLVILIVMVNRSYAAPNSVDFGGVVISTDHKHLSHEIEEHTIASSGDNDVVANEIVKDDLSKIANVISGIGQDISTAGNVMVVLDKNGASIVQENVSAKQNEDIKQLDAVGSNMVKRLLKNYESYKTVLSDKKEEPIKGKENSVFMQHFHNAAGAVLKDGEVNLDELKIAVNKAISTAKDLKLPGTTSMTPDQVAAYIDNHVAATTPLYPAEDIVENKMTDNESSEEIAIPVDESDIGSSYIKVVMIDNEVNLNEMKEDIEKMLEKGDYNENMEDNTDNSENAGDKESISENAGDENNSENAGDENNDRDGRIVNVDGQRRRISSPGATRISSGSSFGSQETFRPRPVYPASNSFSSNPGFSQQPSTMFSGFPTQDIHIHQTDDAVYIPDSNVDVHIHNHPIPVRK